MNDIKYKILTTIDKSDTPISAYELLDLMQDESISTDVAQKHFEDLHTQGLISGLMMEDSVKITSAGRECIDNFEYHESHYKLLNEQISIARSEAASAKKNARDSKIISIISIVIAALGVLVAIGAIVIPLIIAAS